MAELPKAVGVRRRCAVVPAGFFLLSARREEWPMARLQEIRERQGLSRQALATGAGLSRQTVYLIETQRTTPGRWAVQQICAVLAVSAQEIDEFRAALKAEEGSGMPGSRAAGGQAQGRRAPAVAAERTATPTGDGDGGNGAVTLTPKRCPKCRGWLFREPEIGGGIAEQTCINCGWHAASSAAAWPPPPDPEPRPRRSVSQGVLVS